MSELGKQLVEGMKNALAYAEGRPVPETRTTSVEVPAVDVQTVRKELGMTQKRFAETYGFSLSSVRNWEQGTRRPEKAARILLAMIARHPETVRATIVDLERVASA